LSPNVVGEQLQISIPFARPPVFYLYVFVNPFPICILCSTLAGAFTIISPVKILFAPP
jgi:hypothetical protein